MELYCCLNSANFILKAPTYPDLFPPDCPFCSTVIKSWPETFSHFFHCTASPTNSFLFTEHSENLLTLSLLNVSLIIDHGISTLSASQPDLPMPSSIIVPLHKMFEVEYLPSIETIRKAQIEDTTCSIIIKILRDNFKPQRKVLDPRRYNILRQSYQSHSQLDLLLRLPVKKSTNESDFRFLYL